MGRTVSAELVGIELRPLSGRKWVDSYQTVERTNTKILSILKIGPMRPIRPILNQQRDGVFSQQ
jgi:hypothetical protein